jgi:predicted tellurium resistance membrane protein TerC
LLLYWTYIEQVFGLEVIMAIDGQQVRVVMPAHLYDRLSAEAELVGVTMADLVRLSVAARYAHDLQASTQQPPDAAALPTATATRRD